jgi:hypothetical protein
MTKDRALDLLKVDRNDPDPIVTKRRAADKARREAKKAKTTMTKDEVLKVERDDPDPIARKHCDKNDYSSTKPSKRPRIDLPARTLTPVAPTGTTAEEPPWGTGNVLMIWTGEFIW